MKITNCITTEWSMKNHQETWETESNKTILNFAVSGTSKTIIRKEIKLADFSTFLADCGSYMGLFLGASILSLSQLVMSVLMKVKGMIKEKSWNHC